MNNLRTGWSKNKHHPTSKRPIQQNSTPTYQHVNPYNTLSCYTRRSFDCNAHWLSFRRNSWCGNYSVCRIQGIGSIDSVRRWLQECFCWSTYGFLGMFWRNRRGLRDERGILWIWLVKYCCCWLGWAWFKRDRWKGFFGWFLRLLLIDL